MGSLLVLFLLWVTLHQYQRGVVFVDEQLEKAVRAHLGLSESEPISRAALFQIHNLDATGMGIERLDGIASLANLEVLNLHDNRVVDVAPLQDLQKLVELNLRNNGITNLYEVNFQLLSQLPLKSLNLRHNVVRPAEGEQVRLSDIGILAAFEGLEVLHLRDNHIACLAALRGLHHLQELDLRENRIFDISPLADLHRLKHLNLRENQILDISPLSRLVHLTYLNIHSNQDIVSIVPLSTLQNLEILIMRNVPVGSEREVLYALDRLKRLNIEGCGLEKEHAARLTEMSIARRLTAATHESRRREMLPVFNEIMSSNGTVLSDEDGDYPDWVELYNPGYRSVNIGGWGLSDSYDAPYKWIFPDDTVIDAGGFLTVFASGKNRRELVEGANLHTCFRLGATGDWLVLTGPEGMTVDYVEPVALPRDVSYGRDVEKMDIWYYFAEPTPNRPNTTVPSQTFLAPPKFSHEGGFYTNRFSLRISHSDPTVRIIYTLDGSVPDVDNLAGRTYTYKTGYQRRRRDPDGILVKREMISNVYTNELHITRNVSCREHGLARVNTSFIPEQAVSDADIPGATVVRAKAYRQGAVPSEVVSHTFFVDHLHAVTHQQLLTVSLMVNEDDLFDYERGIHVAGRVFDAWRSEHGDRARGTTPANWTQRGERWERPANIEVFDCWGSQLVPARSVGVRIHGGYTRSKPLKSLRLYARRHHGGPIEADIFNTFPCRGIHVASPAVFDRLLLRNSGNDWRMSLYRDAYMQALVAHAPIDLQASRPALVYVNGEFWGIMNFRERLDPWSLSRRYDIARDDVVILTGNSAGIKAGRQGDNQHFLDTVAFVENHDMSLFENYDWVASRVDLENLALYYAIQLYINNQDWPHTNMDWWRVRRKEVDANASFGCDGRWRWLLYDTDHGFGMQPETSYDVNAIDRVVNLTPGTKARTQVEGNVVNRLFRSLVLQNNKFRYQFLNVSADLMNTAFLPERAIPLMVCFEQEIAPFREIHNKRWGLDTGFQEDMAHFAQHRPDMHRKHLVEQFGLGTNILVTVNVSDPRSGYIRLNTIDVKACTPGISEEPYPWSGLYFGNVPITLTAVPAAEGTFVQWTIIKGDQERVVSDHSITVVSAGDVAVKATFAKSED